MYMYVCRLTIRLGATVTFNTAVTGHVTSHVTGHVTGHVTSHVTDHVTDHVTVSECHSP